jgi:hypothetical protein
MNKHDREYAALIQQLAHRYACQLDLVINTDEDMEPHVNKIRRDLAAAGILPGKDIEIALCHVRLAMLQAVVAPPQ